MAENISQQINEILANNKNIDIREFTEGRYKEIYDRSLLTEKQLKRLISMFRYLEKDQLNKEISVFWGTHIKKINELLEFKKRLNNITGSEDANDPNIKKTEEEIMSYFNDETTPNTKIDKEIKQVKSTFRKILDTPFIDYFKKGSYYIWVFAAFDSEEDFNYVKENHTYSQKLNQLDSYTGALNEHITRKCTNTYGLDLKGKILAIGIAPREAFRSAKRNPYPLYWNWTRYIWKGDEAIGDAKEEIVKKKDEKNIFGLNPENKHKELEKFGTKEGTPKKDPNNQYDNSLGGHSLPEINYNQEKTEFSPSQIDLTIKKDLKLLIKKLEKEFPVLKELDKTSIKWDREDKIKEIEKIKEIINLLSLNLPKRATKLNESVNNIIKKINQIEERIQHIQQSDYNTHMDDMIQSIESFIQTLDAERKNIAVYKENEELKGRLYANNIKLKKYLSHIQQFNQNYNSVILQQDQDTIKYLTTDFPKLLEDGIKLSNDSNFEIFTEWLNNNLTEINKYGQIYKSIIKQSKEIKT